VQNHHRLENSVLKKQKIDDSKEENIDDKILLLDDNKDVKIDSDVFCTLTKSFSEISKGLQNVSEIISNFSREFNDVVSINNWKRVYLIIIY